MPWGWHQVDRLRQVDHHQALAGGQQVVGRRSPWVRPKPGHQPHGVGQLIPVRRQQRRGRAGLGQPRRRLRRRPGDRAPSTARSRPAGPGRGPGARRTRAGEIAELGERPLAGLRPSGRTGALGERAAVSAAPHPSALGVGAVAVEQPVLGRCGSAWRRARPTVGPVARSSRKTSASLPVLRMPSSVSMAASAVITQSGHGSGPASDADLVPGGPALARVELVGLGRSRRRDERDQACSGSCRTGSCSIQGCRGLGHDEECS